MKIAVCSIFDSSYTELGNITIYDNCKQYCDKYGYDLIVRTDNFQLPRHQIGFEKIDLILSIMKSSQHDLIFWRGVDTMITNFSKQLTDIIELDNFFIIAADVHGINADSFIIKNCAKSIEFFEEILRDKNMYIDEQHAFKMLQSKYDIKVIPQKFINSYDYKLYCTQEEFNHNGYQSECEPGLDIFGQNGQWSDGDFMIHWPGITLSKRIELANEYQNKVIYA